MNILPTVNLVLKSVTAEEVVPISTDLINSSMVGGWVKNWRVVWMLWMKLWVMLLVVSSTVDGAINQEIYPVDEQVHLGYAIPETHVDASYTLSEVKSFSQCRSICFTRLSCTAVTMDETSGKLECSFTEILLRIGYLERKPGAQTLIITIPGYFVCASPYFLVRGVGCLKYIHEQLPASLALSKCGTDNTSFFAADSSQHLQRLVDNFMAPMEERCEYLWMGIKDRKWAVTQREITEEVENTAKEGECMVVNSSTGKLQYLNCISKACVVCENKYPLPSKQ